MSRCPIARHRTIKDIEEISGHMVQTVRCRSARHRTMVVHKLKKSIVRPIWFVILGKKPHSVMY